MQIDKIVYFAMLLKCVDERAPKPDSIVNRSFLSILKLFMEKNGLKEGYYQNQRSVAYLLTMSKELEIIYKNNKLTPWGSALIFFVEDEVPMELRPEFKILFAKYFLLENFAFIRSLTNHMEQYSVIREDASWYRETSVLPKNSCANTAFSVYINALKIAYESSEGVALQRRYLSLYRQAAKKGKTAKALFPKMKPPIGMMKDVGLLQKRKSNNNNVLFAVNNGHITCMELMKRFQDYRSLTMAYTRNDNLTSIILETYGYQGIKALSESEILLLSESLYTKLADPVFNVCDLDTLVNIVVVKKGLEGYKISEPEVKLIIENASKKDRYKYQILPDRRGKYRFLKIKK